MPAHSRKHFALLRAGTAVLALAGLLWASPAVLAADEVRVRLVTTEGTIDVALFQDRAPRTVANFLRLVDDGFYDGLIFHRVIANFMIQTGGYEPGMRYREPPATVPNESFNGLRNRRGTLAMARLDDPDSAESQFFINVNDNTHLDAAPGRPGYTVFGRVVEGMDVVTAIELADTGVQAGHAGVPDTPIVIEEARRLP
jgi:peptidyl-prolyl cis-trans isomerase A (cyclophilin A)